MKQKLWISWGVCASIAILMMAINNVVAAYGFAILSAAFGWTAFLISE